jgi:hypothetical protein
MTSVCNHEHLDADAFPEEDAERRRDEADALQARLAAIGVCTPADVIETLDEIALFETTTSSSVVISGAEEGKEVQVNVSREDAALWVDLCRLVISENSWLRSILSR